MPGGSARSVQINTADEIDYYNVTINNQKFERLNAGASVESSPIPVGAKVHITVEAIGNVRGEKGPITELQGKRVAFFETTRTMENGGINISVKMGDYKTKYHKVTLNQNGFNGQQTSVEVYVAGGSSYTLPNYGTYTPPQGAPRKHTTWESKQPAMVKQAGESITVTEDMEFAVKWEELATISFNTGNFGKQLDTVYWEKDTYYQLENYGINHTGQTPTKHTGWSYPDGTITQNVGPTARVFITGDIMFELQYAEGTQITVKGALITWHDDTIYEVPSNSGGDPEYYAWRNESLTLPRGTKTDSGDEVRAWGYESPRGGGDVLGSPGSSLDFSQWTYLTAGYSLKPY